MIAEGLVKHRLEGVSCMFDVKYLKVIDIVSVLNFVVSGGINDMSCNFECKLIKWI